MCVSLVEGRIYTLYLDRTLKALGFDLSIYRMIFSMDELESVNQRIEQLKSELSQLEKRRNELLSSTVHPEQTLLTP